MVIWTTSKIAPSKVQGSKTHNLNVRPIYLEIPFPPGSSSGKTHHDGPRYKSNINTLPETNSSPMKIHHFDGKIPRKDEDFHGLC